MTDTKITPNDSNDLLRRLVYGARNQAEELAHKLKPFVLSAMFALSNVSAVPKTDIVKDNTNPYPKTDNVTKDFKNYVELPISGRLVVDDADSIEAKLEEGNIKYGDMAFSAEELNRAKDVKPQMMTAFAEAYYKNLSNNKKGYCLRAFKKVCNIVNNKGFKVFEDISDEVDKFNNSIEHAYEVKPYLDKMGWLVSYKRTDEREISEIEGEIRLFDKGNTESGHIEFSSRNGDVCYDDEIHRQSPTKDYGDLTCYTTKEIMNEVILEDVKQNPGKYKLFVNDDGTCFLAQFDKIPKEYQELYEQYKKEQDKKEQEERKNPLNYADYASNVMPLVGERIDNLRYKLYEASNGDVASATTVKQTSNATTTNSHNPTTRGGGRV